MKKFVICEDCHSVIELNDDEDTNYCNVCNNDVYDMENLLEKIDYAALLIPEATPRTIVERSNAIIKYVELLKILLEWHKED